MERHSEPWRRGGDSARAPANQGGDPPNACHTPGAPLTLSLQASPGKPSRPRISSGSKAWIHSGWCWAHGCPPHVAWPASRSAECSAPRGPVLKGEPSGLTPTTALKGQAHRGALGMGAGGQCCPQGAHPGLQAGRPRRGGRSRARRLQPEAQAAEQQGQAQGLWPSLPHPGRHGTLWVSRRQPNVNKGPSCCCS